MGHLEPTIEDLIEAVGRDNVLLERSAIEPYETATFSTDQRVLLVVLPASVSELQSVVRIANRRALPLYPISRGRNWGLGSRVPCRDRHCVVDLKRMNHITAFDEELGYITVEPGVTFQQVADYLTQQRSKWYLAAIGGPPDSSVLANALERGDAAGLLGDRARYCCALEAVLPTGERVDTGLAVFDRSLTGNLSPFGLGPAVEGLFFQSNMAIVTRMTVWLARRPHHFQCVVFAARDEQELNEAARAVRELQLHGVIDDTAFSLWNIYRFLSAQGRYPWKDDGEPMASPELLLETLPAAWRDVRWVGFVAIYSPSRAHGRASRRMVNKALKRHVSKLLIVDETTAKMAGTVRAPLRWFTKMDVGKMLDTLYRESVFLGHPTKLEISSIYWRKRGPLPDTCDPDRDRCGIHWLCPSLPYAGEHIARVERIVRECVLPHRLEPMCMFFNMNQWYLKSFIVIMFDRDIAAEEEAARTAHDACLDALVRAGYPPVRLGVQSMAAIAPDQADYIDMVRRLKEVLDPNDILAPGRYDFRHRWPEPEPGA